MLSPLPQQAGHHRGVLRGPFPGFLLYLPRLKFLFFFSFRLPTLLVVGFHLADHRTQQQYTSERVYEDFTTEGQTAVVQAPQGSVSISSRPHEALTERCFVLYIVRTRRLVNLWSKLRGRLSRLAEPCIDSSAEENKWHKVFPSTIVELSWVLSNAGDILVVDSSLAVRVLDGEHGCILTHSQL